jgi:SulP family sulfate permease
MMRHLLTGYFGGRVKIEAVIHAWNAEPTEGVVALVTFGLTLLFGPHLDQGILAGVGLSLVLFLFRTRRPRFTVLSRAVHGHDAVI